MSKQANYAIDKSFNDSSKVKEIKSENKYRRVNDEKYLELETQLNTNPTTNEGGDPNISQPATEGNAPTKNEGKQVDWEKRYGDLRSYQSKKETELQASIRELQSKLEQKQNELKYPKTEDEINEWMEKYPEVYAIVKTIAGKASEEQTMKLAQDMEELHKDRARIAYERAYAQLLAFHSDFDEIRSTDEFNDWLLDQPEVLQNAIFKPTLDESGVKAASRVIDLYKKDKGLDTKNTPTKVNNDAAKRVVKSSNEDPEKNDANSGKTRWSESKVRALSTKEFERHMDDIVAAQREGRFDYDLSGAAR